MIMLYIAVITKLILLLFLCVGLTLFVERRLYNRSIFTFGLLCIELRSVLLRILDLRQRLAPGLISSSEIAFVKTIEGSAVSLTLDYIMLFGVIFFIINERRRNHKNTPTIPWKR